jgi:hypothetical protein
MSAEGSLKFDPDKLLEFQTVEILVNDRKEIVFEGIIDPPYIKLHFDRIVNSSRDFDIVKMLGFTNNRKELLLEVFVSKE